MLWRIFSPLQSRFHATRGSQLLPDMLDLTKVQTKQQGAALGRGFFTLLAEFDKALQLHTVFWLEKKGSKNNIIYVERLHLQPASRGFRRGELGRLVMSEQTVKVGLLLPLLQRLVQVVLANKQQTVQNPWVLDVRIFPKQRAQFISEIQFGHIKVVEDND